MSISVTIWQITREIGDTIFDSLGLDLNTIKKMNKVLEDMHTETLHLLQWIIISQKAIIKQRQSLCEPLSLVTTAVAAGKVYMKQWYDAILNLSNH